MSSVILQGDLGSVVCMHSELYFVEIKKLLTIDSRYYKNKYKKKDKTMNQSC